MKVCEERYKYDFEFFAVGTETIIDKLSAQPVRFVLNPPQRMALKDFEEENYLKKVNEDLFRGGELLDVLQGLNSLRDTITENLTQNYRQGLMLKIESANIVNEANNLANSSKNHINKGLIRLH